VHCIQSTNVGYELLEVLAMNVGCMLLYLLFWNVGLKFGKHRMFIQIGMCCDDFILWSLLWNVEMWISCDNFGTALHIVIQL